MKPITIHPLSALAGAALLGLVLIATGAVQSTTWRPETFMGNPFPVHVEGIPRPTEIIRIVEGAPFVVPPGKILVITGGAPFDAVSTQAWLYFDGIVVTLFGSGPFPAPGLAATAGQTVDVRGDPGTGIPSNRFAYGYLADA